MAALTALSSALDQLLAAVEADGLDRLGSVDLVTFLQRFEQLRNRLALVDHRALADAERRDLAGSLCQGRLSRVLQQALQISAGEAGRRVRAAEQLGPRTSMLGEPLPPVRPVLAEAQREGRVTPEQVAVVLSCLGRVDRDGFDRADLARGEAMLTELAGSFGPRDLQRCADRFVECLDPDGNRPRDELVEDRRDVRLVPCRDGGWRADLRLTGVVGAKLQALLSPLARPRPAVLGPDGALLEADERTHGQRMHDALEDLCDRLLRAGDEPGTGGVPVTVVVTIGYEDLLARTGHGQSCDGTRIPTARLLELAAEAEVIPVVLNRSGAVLSLGRSRRIASRAQTLALVARDGGCSFPGCSHPPEWCERHHLRAWSDGGPTDVDNLTLRCRYHHHNFASRGWSCRLDAGGTPTWVPPRFVDPEQRPLVNNRIRAARCDFELMA